MNKQLSERVKSLENTLRVAGEENNRLHQVEIATRQIITQLLQPCPSCYKKMLTLDWNSTVYIVTCDNDKCRKFRQPIKTIKKEQIKWLEILTKKEAKNDRAKKVAR